MIKTFIIEDERKARENLTTLIALHFPQLEITGYAPSVEKSLKLLPELKPDLVFLDIRLADGTGFDVLKQTKSAGFKVIFTTAYEEFALKALKFSALDYLLKPIDPLDLIQAVKKAEVVFSEKEHQAQIDTFLENLYLDFPARKLVLKTAETIYIVKLADIMYCQADKNYTLFFLKNKKRIVVSKTLKEYDELLPKNKFTRIHQSYLINIDILSRVRKNENLVILEDGTQLPVSFRKKELLIHLLNKL